jgi:hypothetical protein
MTDHEHAEISRRLALAIGWEDWQVQASPDGTKVFITTEPESLSGPARYREFDYRAFDVIWPIAERFNCFPMQHLSDKWDATIKQYMNGEKYETAALAVAKAVIAAKEPS